MAGILILLAYLAAGVLCARVALREHSPLVRVWIGLCFGVLLMMWLPVLAGFILRFTYAAQAVALGMLAALCLACALYARRHPGAVRPMDESDRRMVWALVCFALPLTVFSAYLQHTHTLREVDGALHVGQSTYGDLCMHLSIITSMPGSAIPLDYNFLPGTTMGYPILTDGLSASLYMLGLPLRWSIIVPGTLMSALVYAGYLLLARQMSGKTSVALLAGVLLFFNGGLGFLYDFDLAGSDTSRIAEIFTGYYTTPANQPEYNLRWSNLVVDLLLPQRTFLGGWTLLLPALYLSREAFLRPRLSSFGKAAVFAGALPLVQTHAFAALGLYCAGALVWALCTRREERRALLAGGGLYLGVTLALTLPQLLAFTFQQAGSEGFVRLHFNWVNYANGEFVDFYPWFWAKNVGLPLLAMVCALLDWRRTHRMDAVGAAVIFVVAELVLFQPLEYDNNKLFYVWYLLMLPMAASWCAELWKRLAPHRSRVLLAALFLSGSVLSGALSMGREAASDYQLFSAAEAEAAEYINENLERDALFMTGAHHNNPVYTLCGRDIVCGPSLFLHWHGLDYQGRIAEVMAFYRDPAGQRDILDRYGVSYVYLSDWERYDLAADENALDAMFEIVYDIGSIKIYRVASES